MKEKNFIGKYFIKLSNITKVCDLMYDKLPSNNLEGLNFSSLQSIYTELKLIGFLFI